MSDRDYLRVVRQLLAKADSSDHPEEADAFLAKAQDLMANHAIDEAMVAEADETDQPAVITITCQAPYATAKTVLLSGVADANGCQVVRTTSGANQTVEVFGFSNELEHVRLLYQHLSTQATRALLGQTDRSRRFRYAFLLGFATRVSTRLQQRRTHAEQAYQDNLGDPARPGVAVFLQDRRRAVGRLVQESYPNLRTSKVRYGSDLGAAAGTIAGDRADIGHPRLNQPHRRSIDRR